MATAAATATATKGARAALADAAAAMDDVHLRDMIMDADRAAAMTVEYGGVVLDYSRQRLDTRARDALLRLAAEAALPAKVAAMFDGEKINETEGRAVLHTALRAAEGTTVVVDGAEVVQDVWEVLRKVEAFSAKVRAGEWVGATGKPLTDVVAVGIGGSYLGPEFVYEALRMDPTAHAAASGRRLRFLANVDPVDVARATEGLQPETTLVVVISKTFTTAETMLNARTMRQWVCDALGADAVGKHFVAVSTNVDGVAKFGIERENVFGFWDWVGGRFSVCSAVGVVPLALQYGFGVVEDFLKGARDIDDHFRTAPVESNLPMLLGLIGVWNSTYLGYPTRALLPYSQALLKLAPHIQQVDMESNGKGVKLDGSAVDGPAGPINFGEPGTNSQHSFYQLVHQGRPVPCDFIGFVKPQHPVALAGEPVSNHDELMCNFFAQADALAAGKSADQCRIEGVAEALVPHKTFPGNRPSSSLLLPALTPFSAGQLLALFEHRTAVEGFIWGINSFDQWGVELGKVLAKGVRTQIAASRADASADVAGFNPATTAMLKRYLA